MSKKVRGLGIRIGSVTQTRQIVHQLKTSFRSNMYSKKRLVAAGLKVHKTYKSDQESGMIVAQYSPYGFSPSEGTPLDQNITKRAKDRRKIYLATDTGGCCHGRAGFLL